MSRADDASALAAECEAFVRYLSGGPCPDGVRERYARFVEAGGARFGAGRFERWLLRFAGGGAWRLRMGDAYSRLFAPRGALRMRLVLALALLECDPDAAERMDPAVEGSAPGAWLALAGAGLAFGLSLVAGTLVCGAARLVLGGGEARG